VGVTSIGTDDNTTHNIVTIFKYIKKTRDNSDNDKKLDTNFCVKGKFRELMGH
jgi:chromatin remodeling complex protein RSC6